MTDAASIRQGLSRAAWGYLILHLNFNLGNLNLLPDWAGYLLFFSAIGLLGTHLRDLILLKPFCILLCGAAGVDWTAVLMTGQALLSQFFLLNALLTCIALYFSFQLLTDLALLAQEQGVHADGLRICRNIDTVLRVLLLLPLPWSEGEILQILSFALLGTGLVVCLCIAYQLFSLLKYFPDVSADS